MNYAQRITKIRERGQLTVPAEIRQALSWPEEELVVKVETTTSGFKVERLPMSHPQNPIRKLSKQEGNKIWEDMKRISKLGKRGVTLGEFLRRDRDTHF